MESHVCSKRFQGQRGVVEGAQFGADHDQCRGAQVDGQVAQRHARVGEFDQQTAGALDQGQPARAVQAADDLQYLVRAGSDIPACSAAAAGASGCG